MKKYRILSVLWLLLLFSVGCQGKGKEKLVICVDDTTYEAVEGAVGRWKFYGRKGSTIETEIIRIPTTKTAAEIKITELRTEIMSGDGPDVFIFANCPTVIEESQKTETLFMNPEKAMYSEIFLPLDSYLENTEFIHIDNCNQVVLKAGQTQEGQVLLPIIYDYYACVFSEGENHPSSWEEIMGSESMMSALRSQGFLGFNAYLGALADYENEKLLISEEDLLKQFSGALAFQKTWKNARVVRMVHSELLSNDWGNEKLPLIYPIPNIEGGVTANISVYAGINRNTQVAEEAVSLLDTFYELTKINQSFVQEGIFIEQDEFLQKIYKLNYKMSEEEIAAFLDMNTKITVARFYSNWELELWNAVQKQLRKDPEPLEKVVNELYTMMQMQLSE